MSTATHKTPIPYRYTPSRFRTTSGDTTVTTYRDSDGRKLPKPVVRVVKAKDEDSQ